MKLPSVYYGKNWNNELKIIVIVQCLDGLGAASRTLFRAIFKLGLMLHEFAGESELLKYISEYFLFRI